MASETMTLADAIAVVSDMLTNHLRTPDDIAIETLLAHARATTAGTGAGGGRMTDAKLGRIWSLIRDAVKVAARKNTDGMTYEQESAFLDALAADTEQKVAALAPQGVTVTEAMVDDAVKTYYDERYEYEMAEVAMRAVLEAALRAAGVGA